MNSNRYSLWKALGRALEVKGQHLDLQEIRVPKKGLRAEGAKAFATETTEEKMTEQ